ncbi:MAG: TlpA family protein disulfide reductase [Nitrosomonadales bacterium]|nr:TlpA family protein disulfide reductase [Nitrosomonadales bacterium]
MVRRHSERVMNAQRRQLLHLALFGVSLAIFPACRDGAVRLVEGKRFPDFLLPDLDSSRRRFALVPDVPMVVNFWASWCEPCRREMTSLEKLSQIFSGEELLVVGIAVDSDVNLAREFALHYGLTFPLLSDSDQALSNGVLGISAFPTTYLLRRDRIIARIITGERDWADSGMIGEMEASLAIRRHSAD